MGARIGALLHFKWLVLRAISGERRQEVVRSVAEERPVADHVDRGTVKSHTNVGRLLEMRAAVSLRGNRDLHGAQESRTEGCE